MSIKMAVDIEALKQKVAALEAAVAAKAADVVSVPKAEWVALLARVEAAETALKAFGAKVRSKI